MARTGKGDDLHEMSGTVPRKNKNLNKKNKSSEKKLENVRFLGFHTGENEVFTQRAYLLTALKAPLPEGKEIPLGCGWHGGAQSHWEPTQRSASWRQEGNLPVKCKPRLYDRPHEVVPCECSFRAPKTFQKQLF